MAKMTLAEFQASRREVDDVSTVVDSYCTELPVAGFVYAGDLVIEKTLDGEVYLLIGNCERVESADNLAQLEADLFAYGQSEGVL